MLILKLFSFCILFVLCIAPPPRKEVPVVDVEENATPEEVEPASSMDDMDTGLQYDRYLKNVLKILESDSDLKKKLETADLEDIRSGKISNEIQGLPADLRRKLNEEKMAELTRLRKMTQAAAAIKKGEKVRPSAYLKSVAEHLDHKSTHTFGPDDLTQLIQAATKDLNMFDEERHEDFKKHEMQKEMKRKEKMKMLDEQQRIKAEEEYQKRMEELAKKQNINHPVNHPGSKAQMEEVWNEEDELGDMDFNPKTFFKLHDLNDDGVMDAGELEALFEKDLGKIYDPNDPNYDPFQFEEEKRQMREHVMKEVDKNGDGLISLEEFLSYSESSEFEDPDLDSYKTIDQKLYDHSVYTKEELERYTTEIADQEAAIKAKLEVLKAEAKQLGQMRVEHGETKLKVEKSKVPVSEEQKNVLEMQKAEIKQQEQKLQELHKDLQDTSKDIIDKKQELTKHQASDKLVENLQKRLDKLPPGELRDKEEARAEKELENIKKVQGLVPEEDPDPRGVDTPAEEEPVPTEEDTPSEADSNSNDTPQQL